MKNLFEANVFNLIVFKEIWIKDNKNDEFFSSNVAQMILNSRVQREKRKEKNGGGVVVFYDGILRVDYFSNKHLKKRRWFFS